MNGINPYNGIFTIIPFIPVIMGHSCRDSPDVSPEHRIQVSEGFLTLFQFLQDLKMPDYRKCGYVLDSRPVKNTIYRYIHIHIIHKYKNKCKTMNLKQWM